MTTAVLRIRRQRNKGVDVPKLPTRDPRDVGPKSVAKQFTITLPAWLLEKIDEVAEAELYTRNEAVREVLRQFVDEWDAAQVKRGATK